MIVLNVESGERTVRPLKPWLGKLGFVVDNGLGAVVDDLFGRKVINPIHGRGNVIR